MNRLKIEKGVHRDRKYLDYLRTRPDIFDGRSSHQYEAVDPAHYMPLGMGLKAHDFLTAPLMHANHMEQEKVRWPRYIKDRMTPNHWTFMRSWESFRVIEYLTWKLEARNDYELVMRCLK